MKEPKFNIGDRVRLKPSSELDYLCCIDIYVYEEIRQKGVLIISEQKEDQDIFYYKFEEDEMKFGFGEFMLEKISLEEIVDQIDFFS